MTYVDCMIAAVPTANKQTCIDHARMAATVFKKHGALKLVENWGDDIPDGEVTSLPMAVKCKPDETVACSWILSPSKEVRNAGMQAFQHLDYCPAKHKHELLSVARQNGFNVTCLLH